MQEIRSPKPAGSRLLPASRRVLAICGDTQVGLSMLRSLAKNGLSVFAVCNTPQGQSAHSRYAAGAWMFDRSPDAPPPVEQVESLARQLEVGSVMPISESLHKALIANRNRFEPEIHVFSPSAHCFEKATDKAYLHGLCEELGIPVAKGTMLDRLMEAGGDGLEFPLVLRTSRQNDSNANGRAPWKAAYAGNQTDLDTLNASVHGFADNIIVQEYHPGVEDHIHILMHRGEPFMMGLKELSDGFKGRVCFECSPDNRSVLSKGNEQDIKKAVRDLISALGGPKGGLILVAAADNFDCLPSNTRRMVIDTVLRARSVDHHRSWRNA